MCKKKKAEQKKKYENSARYSFFAVSLLFVQVLHGVVLTADVLLCAIYIATVRKHTLHTRKTVVNFSSLIKYLNRMHTPFSLKRPISLAEPRCAVNFYK